MTLDEPVIYSDVVINAHWTRLFSWYIERFKRKIAIREIFTHKHVLFILRFQRVLTRRLVTHLPRNTPNVIGKWGLVVCPETNEAKDSERSGKSNVWHTQHIHFAEICICAHTAVALVDCWCREPCLFVRIQVSSHFAESAYEMKYWIALQTMFWLSKL